MEWVIMAMAILTLRSHHRISIIIISINHHHHQNSTLFLPSPSHRLENIRDYAHLFPVSLIVCVKSVPKIEWMPFPSRYQGLPAIVEAGSTVVVAATVLCWPMLERAP